MRTTIQPLRRGLLAASLLLALGGGTALASSPSSAPAAAPLPAAVHHPRFLPTITPPAPPCPLPPLPHVTLPVLGDTTVGPCLTSTIPQPPAVGQPFPGNMAYWGGHVQVHPKVYLVYLGWGRPGAFTTPCEPVKLVEGSIKATLPCDPDGAGKHMADFTYQLGGTPWAGLQSQYYQLIDGVQSYIHNDANQLGGIWIDDKSPTSAKITYRQMAQEAERAVTHFHVKHADVINSNFVIVQPQVFTDPIAQKSGYCAFHDLIQPQVDPKDYSGLKPGVPYTNMPYVLNQGTGCGQGLVNPGPAGKLDATTLALGHEIEETVTDPGAEDHVEGAAIGGWYDAFDASENGDKCAYVGSDPTGLVGGIPEPGRAANIKGNHGGTFAVQALWSNAAAGGTGYCAGAGNDLPF